jgi:phosphatidylglycerophosphate synthase
VRLPIAPTGWTLLGGIFGGGAAVAVALRVYPATLFLGALAAFCDCADGAVARLRGEASGFGRLLDVTVDKYVEGAIVLGIALGAPPFLGVPAGIYAAIVIWGSILISVIANVGEAVAGRPPARRSSKAFGRAERGIFFGAGVALAWATGDERWLTGFLLALGGLFAHATAIALAADYLEILAPAATPPPPFFRQASPESGATGPASPAPG